MLGRMDAIERIAMRTMIGASILSLLALPAPVQGEEPKFFELQCAPANATDEANWGERRAGAQPR